MVSQPIHFLRLNTSSCTHYSSHQNIPNLPNKELFNLLVWQYRGILTQDAEQLHVLVIIPLYTWWKLSQFQQPFQNMLNWTKHFGCKVEMFGRCLVSLKFLVFDFWKKRKPSLDWGTLGNEFPENRLVMQKYLLWETMSAHYHFLW